MENDNTIKPSLLARQMGANVQEGEGTATTPANPITTTEEPAPEAIERHPVHKKANVQEGEGS